MISLLFNGYYAIGAHSCAECTANALFLILHIRGGVTLGVKLILGDSKAVLGAGVNAQTATLTHIRVKNYFTQFIFLLHTTGEVCRSKIFLLK